MGRQVDQAHPAFRPGEPFAHELGAHELGAVVGGIVEHQGDRARRRIALGDLLEEGDHLGTCDQRGLAGDRLALARTARHSASRWPDRGCSGASPSDRAGSSPWPDGRHRPGASRRQRAAGWPGRLRPWPSLAARWRPGRRAAPRGRPWRAHLRLLLDETDPPQQASHGMRRVGQPEPAGREAAHPLGAQIDLP